MSAITVVIDRRTRPAWVERRAQTAVLPEAGVAAGQVVRSRAGRRSDDPVTRVAEFNGGSEGLSRRRPGSRLRRRRAA